MILDLISTKVGGDPEEVLVLYKELLKVENLMRKKKKDFLSRLFGSLTRTFCWAVVSQNESYINYLRKKEQQFT